MLIVIRKMFFYFYSYTQFVRGIMKINGKNDDIYRNFALERWKYASLQSVFRFTPNYYFAKFVFLRWACRNISRFFFIQSIFPLLFEHYSILSTHFSHYSKPFLCIFPLRLYAYLQMKMKEILGINKTHANGRRKFHGTSFILYCDRMC